MRCFNILLANFHVISNYVKQTSGLFAETIGFISALTALQYTIFINNNPMEGLSTH